MAYDFNSKSGGSEGTWADNSGGSAGAWADSSDRGSYPDPAPVRQRDPVRCHRRHACPAARRTHL